VFGVWCLGRSALGFGFGGLEAVSKDVASSAKSHFVQKSWGGLPYMDQEGLGL
jgi:hypothetical protein